MGAEPLVEASQVLTKLLDDNNFSPLAVIWMRNPETLVWKLWIVPPLRTQKEEFFLTLSKIFSANRGSLLNLDISSIEYKTLRDKSIELIGGLFRVVGIGSVSFSNTTFDGFLVDAAVIVRLAL